MGNFCVEKILNKHKNTQPAVNINEAKVDCLCGAERKELGHILSSVCWHSKSNVAKMTISTSRWSPPAMTFKLFARS